MPTSVRTPDEIRAASKSLGVMITHNRDRAAESWENPLKLTCPDGSTFEISWTPRGLRIIADTLADGGLATDVAVLPDTANIVTVKAMAR